MAILYEPNKPSKIAIVGEAPGEQEERTGKPFVGPSGRLLTKLCNQAGLSRFDCYITNVVDVRPPNNKFDALPLDVVMEGTKKLKERLEKWKPNVVLAVGAKPLEALTGLKQITRYRGAVMPSTLVPGLKIVATLHPANLLRGNMKMAPIVINDIAKAVRESKYPEIRQRDRNIEIVKDKIRALNLLNERPKKPIVIDIETAGHILTAFGVATSDKNGYSICIDLCRDVDVLKAIGRLCNSDVPKIYHNALYDVLWLAYYLNICTKNIYFDTMVAQHVCYPIYPKSLGFCASIWTDEAYWKDQGKEAFDPKNLRGYTDWDKLYTYNVKDCLLTYEIYNRLKQELKNNNLEDVFATDMSLLKPLLFAMLHGVDIDEEAKEIVEQKNEDVIRKLEILADEAIPDVNVKSHKQLKELFYDKWGFKPIKNKGRITTDTRALDKLEGLPTPYKPIIGLIRNLKDYYKRRTFYNITTDPDNRVRTAYKITGTISGRLSSAKGITGSGSNVQNVPKPMRRLYIPPKGYIFIQGDLSQAEARIVAALCGDLDWLHEFDVDDVYWSGAEFLFKKDRKYLIKSVHRQIAKKVSHATHYKMSWSLLRELIHCDAKTAKKLINYYYEMRPKLKDWQEGVAKQIRKDHEIRTPYGRRLIFPNNITDDDIRQAISFVPQSCCAQYNNNAWIRQYKEMPQSRILIQVHDSLVHAVPDNINVIKQTMKDMKRLTEVPLRIGDIDLIIPVDFEIGYNWYDMKECNIDNVEETYEILQNAA